MWNIENDLVPLNISLHSDFKKAQDRTLLGRLTATVTLRQMMMMMMIIFMIVNIVENDLA